MRILLCEDDENLGMLLREYLQAKGYETELCPDGEAGYRAFTQSRYDLCVLDVMMPKKDGFSLARDIRQINEETPIIFLTAKTLKEDILEGFRIGADDYLTKPFSMEELTFRIEAVLRRVRGKKNRNRMHYKIGSFSFDNVLISEFRVNEKTKQPQWHIVSDSVATILGYRCTLATTQFKGRKWLAWYTEDIPLSYGPWKLCGLPGLILRAYDSERQYVFEATGMSQPNGSEPIKTIKGMKRYETVSLKDYLKALREVTPGEALSVKGVRIEGGDEEWQKQLNDYMKKVAPSNPIEKEE